MQSKIFYFNRKDMFMAYLKQKNFIQKFIMLLNSIFVFVIIITLIFYLVFNSFPFIKISGKIYFILDKKIDISILRDCNFDKSDIKKMNNFRKVESLGLSVRSDKFNDFSFFKNMNNLKILFLDVYGSSKMDFSDLTNCKFLEEAYIDTNYIDLQCFKECSKLKILSVYASSIDNVTSIKNCKDIKTLYFWTYDNNIYNLSSLYELDNLAELHLNTKADDYSFLKEMKSLKKLSVPEDEIPKEIISYLKENGVEITFNS